MKKIRRIEIVTNRLVNDMLGGAYRSAFKGQGMDFDEVRGYQPGDEIRMIDWNVSARAGDLFVKRFKEERELTVMLLVDLSGSSLFGTQGALRRDIAAELAAILAFSAIKNNDQVGLIMFSDKIEKFVAPKKGRKHVLRVIREILSGEPSDVGTDLSEALGYLTRVIKRKAVTFVISDFIANDFETALSVAQRRHDVVPVLLRDPAELKFPPMGVVQCRDPETGERIWIDTFDSGAVKQLQAWYEADFQSLIKMFNKHRMDSIVVDAEKDHAAVLVDFFAKRSRRR